MELLDLQPSMFFKKFEKHYLALFVTTERPTERTYDLNQKMLPQLF